MSEVIKISMEVFTQASSDYEGICLECGEFRECVEPDAEEYECYDCGAMAVMGIEQAVMSGEVEIE